MIENGHPTGFDITLSASELWATTFATRAELTNAHVLLRRYAQ
jgi:hypothetical protein